MKKHSLYISLILIICFSSCSSEDVSVLNSDANYFPLKVGNSWAYENEIIENSETLQGIETLTVEEENQNRYNFTQTVTDLEGVFTGVLSSGILYKENSNQKIIYDGQFVLALDNESSNLSIPLEDIILYDANLSQGSVMSSGSGTFQQDINGFPIDFNFEINSIHRGFTTEKIVNGMSYEDVFISDIEISLSASVFLVISDFTILQEQRVTKITNYYAENVGLILSEVTTEAIFEDIPEQLNADIQDINFTSSQILVDYSLENNL